MIYILARKPQAFKPGDEWHPERSGGQSSLWHETPAFRPGSFHSSIAPLQPVTLYFEQPQNAFQWSLLCGLIRCIPLPHFGQTGAPLSLVLTALRIVLGFEMLFFSSLNVESPRASSISQRGSQQPLFLLMFNASESLGPVSSDNCLAPTQFSPQYV